MKRSHINGLIRSASECFTTHGWSLPPRPRWDVTDFGLGDWEGFGLVLITLAEEPEYCEKVMYARRGMTTPAHTHRRKKEDIICRWGTLAIMLWNSAPDLFPHKSAPVNDARKFTIPFNDELLEVHSGVIVEVPAGSRVRLHPGIYHAFYPLSEECIIGEVSTANDDVNDNIFVNPEIGRYPGIEEDEEPLLRLVGENVTSKVAT